jgi:hypothetical protein
MKNKCEGCQFLVYDQGYKCNDPFCDVPASYECERNWQCPREDDDDTCYDEE